MYSTGLGLAAGYIESHLGLWHAKPAGDPGSFLQTVRVLGVKSTNRSTLTVEVNGRTRTFTDGDGVTFPRDVGARRRFTLDRVEFAGYGLDVPRARHVDIGTQDVKGAAVVWLGQRGPRDVDTDLYRVLLVARDRYATEQLQAAASIGPGRVNRPEAARPGGAGAAGRGRGNQLPAADFTTVERLDRVRAPNVTGSDAFFEFLFSARASQVRRAQAQGRRAGAAAVVPARRASS